jgi:DNA (cytosine-5)-methyltransferase 1
MRPKGVGVRINRSNSKHKKRKGRSLTVASLFSGIGGFELGLQRTGHEICVFCENNIEAQRVLHARFPGVPVRKDIRTVKKLPAKVNLITAGFPCQDLSPVGKTAGLRGTQFKLVWEVFRLLDKRSVEFVLFENVPFMLRLGKGRAIEAIVSELEKREFKWAYRTVDSQSFGLPQRRPRVFLLASKTEDPRAVLMSEDAGKRGRRTMKSKGNSYGFYWTEGNRGIGWAVESLPALKGGSGLGIPSAPAMILSSGEVATPHLCDAERLQGFPEFWTSPAARGSPHRYRWRLIGNAVNVRVAEWIGRRLARPLPFRCVDDALLDRGVWPRAAYNAGDGRRHAAIGPDPVRYQKTSLNDFLRFPPRPLSLKASNGVIRRLRASTLRVDPILLSTLDAHVARLDSQA